MDRLSYNRRIAVIVARLIVYHTTESKRTSSIFKTSYLKHKKMGHEFGNFAFARFSYRFSCLHLSTIDQSAQCLHLLNTLITTGQV